MELLTESPAWTRFTKSLRSEFTRRCYEFDLKRFMKSTATEPDELLTISKPALQDRIINYVIARQETDGIRAQSMNKELSALRHFFQHNDRTDINWTIVKGYVKAPVKAVRDRAYTVEEIVRMLEYSDYRTRVVILLMCSSGIRLGAIPELKKRQLQEVKGQKLYAITVYENTTDEYTTYCSPECRSAIETYLDYRKRNGEIIKEESPLIREQFDSNDKFKVLNPKQVDRSTVSSLINSLAFKAGLRQKSRNKFERKETMLNHGMRKLFFRACAKARIDPVIREYLMGHKIGDLKTGVTKLMMIYDATEDNEVLKAYLSVVNLVTIDPSHRLAEEVAVLEEKLKDMPDLKVLQEAIVQKELQMEAMRKHIEEKDRQNEAFKNEIYEAIKDRVKRGEIKPLAKE